MPLPPEIEERVSKSWDTLKPEIQDRLVRSGYAPTSVTTTATTTTPHPFAESAGAFIGGVVPGPAGIVTAGVGDVAARALAEGRVPTLKEGAKAFGRGAGGQVIGLGLAKALGWGARALGLGRSAEKAAEVAGNVASAKKLGIPLSAADATGSRPLAQIENLPNYFAIGSGPVQRFRAGQIESAAQATGKMVDSIAEKKADDLTMGYVAQGGVNKALSAFKTQKTQLFNHVEQLAGDAPVITVAPEAVRGLSVRGTLGPILEKVHAGEPLSFKEARALETEFGARGFRGPQTIGTLAEGDYKSGWRAVHQSIEDWMTTPEAGNVAPELAEAKQYYATGKNLIQNSVGKLVVGGKRSPVDPEKVISRVFRPGAITDTIDYREVVSPEVWDQSVQTWADNLYKDAHINGQFVPSRFVKAVAKYDRAGQLDVILGPERANEWRVLTGTLGKLGTAERIAGNPSGTGQAVLSTGQMMGLGRAVGQGSIRDVLQMTLLPRALGGMTTSPRWIPALTQEDWPSVLEALARAPARGVGQELLAEKRPPGR